MKSPIKAILLFFGFCLSITGTAQTLESGYFLKDYNSRYVLNPALENERGYLAFPLAGFFSVGTNGNIGISNFLFEYDDPQRNSSLTTFMNSSVDADDFLGKLNKNNRMNIDFDLNILSLGFRAFKGFNNIGINLRSDTRTNLPLELFSFMKSGNAGGTLKSFDLSEISFSNEDFIDVSLNHSHQIGERLRIGATLKALVGVAALQSNINKLSVTMGEDKWIIDANGSLDAALKGLVLDINEEGNVENADFNVGDAGISGLGFGVDLGATFEVLDNLTVSASLNDLGFIKWTKSYTAVLDSNPYEFAGFTGIGVGGDSENNSLEDDVSTLADDIADWAKYSMQEGNGTYKSKLNAVLRIGAEYELPAYRKLSFGLLSTSRFHETWTESQLRAFANISPAEWFSASVNGGYSTYGGALGCIVSVHPAGFTFFVGSDWLFFKHTPQFLPVKNLNTSICAGFQVTVGKKLEH